MNKPKLEWKPFDYENPSSDLPIEMECDINYLILIADYGYNPTENTVPEYYTDIATAYGSYLDNFWDTTNDWDEGQVLHVVAYCYIGDQVKLEKENDIAIAYICDKTACKDCNSQSECSHTTEIKYAKHFEELVPGRYFEQEEKKDEA